MTATATKTADRLSFYWEPSFRPEYRLDVTVVERRPRAGDRATGYAVDEAERLPGGRLFLVAKHPDETAETCERHDEVYETYVGDDGGHACTCKGSACRRHEARRALPARGMAPPPLAAPPQQRVRRRGATHRAPRGKGYIVAASSRAISACAAVSSSFGFFDSDM